MGGRSDARPRAIAACLLGVTAFGLVTLASSGETIRPTLLFDGASYVALAQHIRTHWFIPPPSLNLRPPLYPTLLAVAGWLTGSDGLTAVVSLQVIVWLLTGAVAAAWVGLVSGRPLLGVVAGCLYYTLAESFFNVSLVYAETVAAGLAAASGLALTRSLAGSPRAAAWRWLAATLALSAAYARPIFQLLLPLFLAFAAARCLGSGRAVLARVALPFVVAIGVGLLPVYVANAVVKGSPSFVSVTGHTLTNYLGDRRLLGRFPPDHAAVEAIYAARFAAEPGKSHVAWWEVTHEWDRLVESRTGRRPTWGTRDAVMSATAVTVLSRNPDYYVRRWSETWREFSTTAGPPAAGAWSPITLLVPAWRCFWSSLGAWIPFLVVAIEATNTVRHGRDAVVRLVPGVTYLALALANTALEPWPGQIRYRTQVEVFLVIALALGAMLLWDRGRAALRRAPG